MRTKSLKPALFCFLLAALFLLRLLGVLAIAYGRIKTFYPDKGYGFIVTAMSGDKSDVFVALADLPGRLPPATGQRVAFEVTATRKGLQARSVEYVR